MSLSLQGPRVATDYDLNQDQLIVLVKDSALLQRLQPYSAFSASSSSASENGTLSDVTSGAPSEHFLFLRGGSGGIGAGGVGGGADSGSVTRQVAGVFVLSVIALVGIVGNLLIAFTLIRRKQLKYPSNR